MKSPFENVKYFLMFLGRGRCGSSLLGALINCHPNAVVVHELNHFKLKYEDRDDLFNQILLNHGSRRNLAWPSYQDHWEWNFKYKNLFVIGTKHAGGVTNKIKSDSKSIMKFKKFISTPVKFIHVRRNPYDNIATVYNKSQIPRHIRNGTNMKNIDRALKYYFEGISIAKKVEETEDVLNIKHEDVVNNTRNCIKRVMNFLDLPILDEHIKYCKELIWEKPRITRDSVEWTKKQIEKIERLIEKYNLGY